MVHDLCQSTGIHGGDWYGGHVQEGIVGGRSSGTRGGKSGGAQEGKESKGTGPGRRNG